MLSCSYIRKIEQEGRWKEALTEWNKFLPLVDKEYRDSYKDERDAVQLIVYSTRLGDEYRSLTKGIFEQFENREINKYQLSEKLSTAHKRVYSGAY